MRLLVLLVLASCGGSGNGVNSPCASRDDCNEGLGCMGPNDRQACGIPPREECMTDAQCTGGDRCHAINDACSADGVGSECKLACTGDGACGVGFRCDNGACVAIACDAGFTCPQRQTCTPSMITTALPVHARHHACFDVSCTDDDGCGGRFSCVNGICQDGAGTCQEPIQVP